MSRLKLQPIQIAGRRTSIRLEPEMWYWLRQCACEQGRSATVLIEEVDRVRRMKRPPHPSLSSTLRVHITRWFREHPLPKAAP